MRAYLLVCDGMPTDTLVWDDEPALGTDPIEIADYCGSVDRLFDDGNDFDTDPLAAEDALLARVEAAFEDAE